MLAKAARACKSQEISGDVLVGAATVVGDTVTFTFSRNGVLQTFGD
jgi:hypothetical protein